MVRRKKVQPRGESVVALEPQPSALITKPAPFLLHSLTLRALLPHLWEKIPPNKDNGDADMKDRSGPDMPREEKFVLECVQSFPGLRPSDRFLVILVIAVQNAQQALP